MKKIFTLIMLLLMATAYGQTWYTVSKTPILTNCKYPVNTSFGYTRSAVIYQQTDMVRSGTITGIGWYVTSTATDSIPIKVYLKNSSFAYWGGSDNWAFYTATATLVYQGKISAAQSGYTYVTFQTPFVYNIASHIAVLVEANYGGTGQSPSPSFAGWEIDSYYDWYHLRWAQNTTPPTNMGLLEDYMPAVRFVFQSQTVLNATSATVTPACGHNTLNWQNNAANDTIVITYNHTGNFSTPQNGMKYNVGSMVGMDTIIYVGKASSFTHNNVKKGMMYRYRIWHKNIYNEYSTGVTASATSAFEAPVQYNFDGGPDLPSDWYGNMELLSGHGTTAQALIAELNSSATSQYARTAAYCNITSNTKLEFNYRIVNQAGYPGTPTPLTDMGSIDISVSTDNGSTWTVIHSINNTNHTASAGFALSSTSLGAYAGQMIRLKITCNWGAGSYFVDIDDLVIHESTTSIKEDENLLLSVSPNPFSQWLGIDLSAFSGTGVRIEIRDISGRLMLSENSTDRYTLLDLGSLPAGIYILRTYNASATGYARIVKM
jgi:hypothetical protein